MDGMSINADGKNGSFWFDGTVMYGVVCTYANLWLIQRTNTHDGVLIFLNIYAIASFYVWWWFENLYSVFPQVYGIFDNCFSMTSVWLVTLLLIWANYALDMVTEMKYYYKNLTKYQDHLKKLNKS